MWTYKTNRKIENYLKTKPSDVRMNKENLLVVNRRIEKMLSKWAKRERLQYMTK